MRIAFLTTGFSQGNKEATKITISLLARTLQKQGQEISIITQGKSSEHEQGLSIFRASSPIVKGLLSYPLALHKTQKKFHILHGFSAAPALILRSLLSRHFSQNAKIVHSLKSYSKSKWGRKGYWLLNSADVVTVPTEVFRRRLIARGVKERKIRVIRSPIDCQRFVPFTAAEKSKLRKKLGLSKKTIFYYGGTWNGKGVQDLLRAFTFLLHQHDAELLLAPRYPLEKKHLQTIQQLGIADRVRMVQEEIDVPKYLNAVDLLVLPYRSLVGTEGNPSCLLEAMACKTPVVTTALPELQEIVGTEKEVLMVRPRDPASLALAMARLLENATLRKRLTENAHRKAQEFDVKKIASELMKVYKIASIPVPKRI